MMIPTISELKKNGGICPICGYEHVPESDDRLADFPAGDIRVDRRSPSWLHGLVFERARYLQRQEFYDFPQWDEKHGIADNEVEKDHHALLLVEPPHIPIGAASWSWVLWGNHVPTWNLNFIWVAGIWRHKGMLSRRWPSWLQAYGNFMICTPWSKDMLAFLEAKGVPSPT